MSQSLLSKIDQAVLAHDPLTISRSDVAQIAMEVTIAEAAERLEALRDSDRHFEHCSLTEAAFELRAMAKSGQQVPGGER